MPYLQNHAFVVQSPPAFSSYHPAPSSSRQPPQYKYRDVTHNTSVLTHGSFCGTATVQCSSRHRAAAADCHGSWDQPEGAATGLKSLAAIVDVDVGERTSAAASAAVSAVTSLELGGASSPRLISAAPEVEKVPSIEGEQMVKGGDDPDAAASIVAASRDSCGISISSTCSSNVNLSKSSSDGQQRLTSTDLHTFLAKQGIRAEVVSEVTPGSLPAGQGIVKSIVMMEVAEGRSERPQLVPLLVVVRLEDRVDERRVAELLKVPRRRLRLARADEVLTHTGFAVGTVPPFGHRVRLRTLVDTAVTRLAVVYGGGGDPDKEISVAVPDLLSYSNGIVADVSVGAAAATVSAVGGATTSQPSLPPLPLPWPSGSQSVELVGVVAQRRRIARLLQFVNLVPEQLVPVLPGDGQAVFLRRLWRHPESGQPVEVQLILGKTLERNVGRDKAQALMDQVKVGSIVAITGRVQPHPGAHRATTTATSTSDRTGSSSPATTTSLQPSQQQTSPGSPRQLREDVLDVVCHSVIVIHKNKDHLNNALRAAQRAGLGSPATAAELLRLQQLRGQQPWPVEDEPLGASRKEPLAAVAASATVGAGVNASERRAVAEGFKLAQPAAAGRQSSIDPWVNGRSSLTGVSSNAASVPSNRHSQQRPQELLQREEAETAKRTISLEAHRPANRPMTSTQTTLRGGISVGAAAGGREAPGRLEDEEDGAVGFRAQDSDVGAQAVGGRVATGWRMRLPLAAVRLVSTATEVAEMQREIFALPRAVQEEEEEERDGDESAEVDAKGRGIGSDVTATATATAAAAATSTATAAAAAAATATAAAAALTTPLADLARVVALDCEWAPYERHQPKNPVSVLQVATRDRVYLLDLLGLMAPEEPKQLRNHLQHHYQEEHGDDGDHDHADGEQTEEEGGSGGAVAGAVAPTPTPAPAPARKDSLSEGALALSGFLSRLLSSEQIVKLGFQLVTDLDRLCESYPHLPCFTESSSSRLQPAANAGSASAGAAAGQRSSAGGERSSSVDLSAPASDDGSTGDNGGSTAGSYRASRPRTGSRGGSSRNNRGNGSGGFATTALRNQCRLCVDVVALARCLRQDLARTPQISLSRLVALVLGEALDKTQQTSNWACRPLTEEQVLYAATDAYCLIALYDALLGFTDCNSRDEDGSHVPTMVEKIERAGKILQVVTPTVKKCLPLGGLRTARSLGEDL